MAQHLNNKVGNLIGEARRRLLDKLKTGADFDEATSVFIAELRLGFETIKRSESESENVKAESVSSFS